MAPGRTFSPPECGPAGGFDAHARTPGSGSLGPDRRIEHPAPWVTVTGELDETTGAYRATGTGRVGSFSNVSSAVVGTFQRSGDTVTAVDLTVTLGENGVFPGGRPVSYSVRLRKAP